MKRAPASTFLYKRINRISNGSANGLQQPQSGNPLLFSFHNRKAKTAIHLAMVAISWIESRSNTPLASGWSPNFWWSPVRQSTLLMPNAAAPNKSLCIAILLRSRHVICIIVRYLLLIIFCRSNARQAHKRRLIICDVHCVDNTLKVFDFSRIILPSQLFGGLSRRRLWTLRFNLFFECHGKEFPLLCVYPYVRTRSVRQFASWIRSTMRCAV